MIKTFRIWIFVLRVWSEATLVFSAPARDEPSSTGSEPELAEGGRVDLELSFVSIVHNYLRHYI
jgi:hypothetical protein